MRAVEAKKKERKKKERRVFLIVLLGLCAVILLLLSPLCAIRHYDIAPMSHYDNADIEEFLSDLRNRNGFLSVANATSLSQSKSLFSMEMPELEKQMLFELPYLENVTVRYAFPNTVLVRAEERKASFLLEHYGIYLLLDTHGVVLETFTEEDKPDMPLVKGVEIGSYKIGTSISNGKNDAIDCTIKVCGMIAQLSMESYVDLIDVTDCTNIQMYCAPSLTILFGDGTGEIGVKLAELKGILNSGLDGNADGILNMKSNAHATFTKNEPEKPEEPLPEDGTDGEAGEEEEGETA